MKRLLQFVGLFTIIAAAVKGIIYLKANSSIFNEALKFIGLLTIILLIAYVVVRAIWGDRWLIKGGKSFLIGTSLIEAFKKFMEELPTPSKPTTAALAGHLVYRFTRIGILGLGIALLPAILLWQQNQLFQHQNIKVDQQTDLLRAQDTLIREQNSKFEIQNKLFNDQNESVLIQTKLLRSQDTQVRLQNDFIATQTSLFGRQIQQTDKQIALLNRQDTFTDMQIKLSDGDRLSSLNFLLGGLFQQIQKDIKERKDSTFNLSDATIGRIAGLSQSFRPYYFLIGDTLIAKPLSPERGQLLVALVNSNLNDTTYLKVFRQSTFAQAYLREANLRKANLNWANLRGANLREADLELANLTGANLEWANLELANLRGANLDWANLNWANLNGANLELANLYGANLNKASLIEAKLNKAQLNEAKLMQAKLEWANLEWASLRGANLMVADLRGANLYWADLRGANLDWANLRGANLDWANLTRWSLTLEQLKSVESLHKTTDIPPEIKAQLRKCLFEEDGCK